MWERRKGNIGIWDLMGKVPEVELAAGTISTHRSKKILLRGKTYIINFLIMS
jgi:hypothetical protein